MHNAIERVESKKAERVLTFIKAMIFLIILVPTIIVAKNYDHIDSLKLSNFTQIFLGLFLLSSFHIQFAKRRGQFIEWGNDEIRYKTREDEGIIDVRRIKNITVSIDTITITLEDDGVHTLNLADFTNYEKRLKIKDHFSNLNLAPVANT